MSAGLLLFRSLAPVMGLPDCTYLLLVYINSERRCVYIQQDVCWMMAMCVVKELQGRGAMTGPTGVSYRTKVPSSSF